MTDSFDLWIVGAGGFGRELLAMLWEGLDPGRYRLQGFLAQRGAEKELAARGVDLRVEGDPSDFVPGPRDRFLLAIGQMDARRDVVRAIESKGGRFATFVHPLAYIAPTATIGPGAVVYPFAVVSNASVLRAHVHLSYYASVGHDCDVGAHCLLAPYATLNGSVTLEDEVYVSTHASVAPGRKVGYRSKLSANSACMQDAPHETFIFGVPGRQVPRLDIAGPVSSRSEDPPPPA